MFTGSSTRCNQDHGFQPDSYYLGNWNTTIWTGPAPLAYHSSMVFNDLTCLNQQSLTENSALPCTLLNQTPDTDGCKNNPCASIAQATTCVDAVAPLTDFSCGCAAGFEWKNGQCAGGGWQRLLCCFWGRGCCTPCCSERSCQSSRCMCDCFRGCGCGCVLVVTSASDGASACHILCAILTAAITCKDVLVGEFWTSLLPCSHNRDTNVLPDRQNQPCLPPTCMLAS